MIKKIKNLFLFSALLLVVLAFSQSFPATSYAASSSTDPAVVCHPENSTSGQKGSALTPEQLTNCENCIKKQLAPLTSDQISSMKPEAVQAYEADQNAAIADCVNTNPIIKDLNIIINVVAGLVGVVVIGLVIVGGIQYSLAGGKQEAVSAARKRVANAIVAFFFFLFIYGILQWLIPGGL